MSQIATSRIFIHSTFDSSNSGLVEKELKATCENVVPTRKGRFWETYIDNSLYTVEVKRTEEWIDECEDDLLELELLPDDVPEFVLVTSSGRKEKDLNGCWKITERLKSALKGISNEPKISS